MLYRRIGKKKYSIYAFDFETHNCKESINKKETSVWLGCLINDESKKNNEDSYFYSTEEFLQRLQDLSSRRRQHGKKRPTTNLLLYDYNLAFEWSFMLPVMLKMGFQYQETITEESEMCFNSVSTKSCSSVWQVQMKFSKSSGMIVIRDLAKIFGGGLAKVAKSFNLKTQKGTINYRKCRLHNYTPTKKEKYYCFNDCKILVEILQIMDNKDDKIFFNSASMATYASTLMIRTGYPKSLKPYASFRAEYPMLEAKENLFLRKGVEGGITYAPSKWQYVDIQAKILHIDAHQMHPTQAYFQLFPYGKGEYHKGKPTDFITKINCMRIKISYSGVKLHSIIKLIGNDFADDMEITIWDFELRTMYKCYYNLEVEYIDYYSYNIKRLTWRKFYSNNYKLRLKAKAEKDQYNILYYKLLNNSSYGKLLEKPHNEIIINYINEEGIIDSIVKGKAEGDIKANAKYTYLPVGSAIPAYSRCNLIETALTLNPEGDKVLYFDTDSIFILYDSEVKRVWESSIINKQDFLGGWAVEEFLTRAEFSAPKRYKTINEETGETTIKMAGINFNNEEFVYNDFNIDSDKYTIQRAFRVKGGTIVDVQLKKVDVQTKYKPIYEANKNKVYKMN